MVAAREQAIDGRITQRFAAGRKTSTAFRTAPDGEEIVTDRNRQKEKQRHWPLLVEPRCKPHRERSNPYKRHDNN